MKPARLHPAILTLSLLVSGTGVRADEHSEKADTTNWHCNFCSYASGWFGAVDAGPGYASDRSLKFADYRGIDDEGLFLSVYGDVHYRNDQGDYYDLYARDLGTDARRVEMRGGHQGRYELRLAYQEIPTYRGFGTQTVFRGVRSDTLTLPADFVKAGITPGMSSLDEHLNSTSLLSSRKNIDAGLDVKISGNWRYSVDVRHSEKEGSRAFGAGVFTLQSTIFPAPVDFTTNRIDMDLDYSGKRSHLRFGLSSSTFRNGNQSVTWENPFSPVGSTGLLRAALVPDSDFHQVSVTAAFKPNPRVRMTARAAFGQISQDDPFLPYSINPTFDDLSLPFNSLGQETDTLNLAASMVARLSDGLTLTARIKTDERDNQTPVEIFTPVITDLVLRPDTLSRPYSFERRQYSLELAYRARPGIQLLTGVKRRDYERTLQSVRETEDNSIWGELSLNHWSSAQLRLRLETSDRDISPYVPVSDPGLEENALMRKFHLADRERDRAGMELDLMPGGKFNASLSYFVSKDEYEQSLLGLLDSEEHSYNFDMAYAINPGLGLQLFASHDEFDSRISGAVNAFATPWNATTRDRFTTFGAGLSGRINERIELSLDYVSSDSSGHIQTVSLAGNEPFPELKTELSHISLQLSYRTRGRWGWTLIAEHENYDSSDWQIDGLGVDGIDSILTLGQQSPDYSVSLIRLHANYRF